MTSPDRVGPAATDPYVAISASDLLAPFNDSGVLSPLDVHAATVIARLWAETDRLVMLAAALAVRGTRFGHVCVRLATQREAMVVDGQAPEVIEALPWPEPHEWESAVAGSRMVGDGGGDEPLVLMDDRLYVERYFRYEEQVVDLIEGRTIRTPTSLAPEVRAELDRLLPRILDGAVNRQHSAVATSLSGRLTVIAGGPGTGKTYTVAALLAALAQRPVGEFPMVALCAPTGKAAARLGEEVAEFAARLDDPAARERLEGLGASTIHRLLGWAWGRGRFRHHERNRLPHDLVVVDEMSMVSLPLAAKLIAAVRDDAAIVLVGDPFQLESIEAGTVLADIVGPAVEEDREVPTAVTAPIADRVVVLDRVHRFAERDSIAGFAEAVRRGDADRALDLLGLGLDGLRWVEGRSQAGFEQMWERVIAQRSRLVEAAMSGDQRAAFGALGSLAVLCVHREGPGSVAQWRMDIETALDERFPGLRYGGEWYPGRPVMITSNDYNLGLYNGDIGVAARTEHGLRAVFERGGIRSFPLGYLGEHTTVHAMTIHKSQGSQFGEVLVSLPSDTSRLLTRELLYTAVTRASEVVTVIGEESVIRRAVEHSVQRASGLRSRLWD